MLDGLCRHIGLAFTGLLAPPVCALCDAPGQQADEPWGIDLCVHCEAACRRAKPEDLSFGQVFCLFRYQDPVDRMITGLKFGHELVFARILGTLLARARRLHSTVLPECIVPLPLHLARYRERGFCQTTELARHMAPRLRDPQGRRLPVRSDLLRRVRATRAQSGLSAAERAANLRGAFATGTTRRVPRHVALVDDVLTTGHTAMAAVEALHQGGVERVEIWCCARA